MSIEITKFSSTTNPHFDIVKLPATRIVPIRERGVPYLVADAQPSPVDRWIVRNTRGRMSFWDPNKGDWSYGDIWEYTMPKDEALEILNMLDGETK
jgi:hypothetical protein